KSKKVPSARFFNDRAKPMRKIKITEFAAIVASLNVTGGNTTGGNAAGGNATAAAPAAQTTGGLTTNRALFAEALSKVDAVDFSARADIVKAVTAHYLANPEFMWVSDSKPVRSASEVLAVLNSADDYGLEAADYKVELPVFNSGESALDEPFVALINFEFALTLRAVRYALDANGGRVNPNKLSGYHDFPGKKLSAANVVAALYSAASGYRSIEAESGEGTASLQLASIRTDQVSTPPLASENSFGNDAAAYLLSLQPDHPSVEIFRQELATLRQSIDNAIVIAPDTLVKPGKSHVEMPNIVKAIQSRGSQELLAEFAETLANYQGSEEYTPDLVALVKGFQKENKLKRS
ncbi:MAG: hypothetical protein L3I99_02435, partial [Sulfurimonas sp.]|nr:hypothetical protein [Sulfurimonas sp.]